MSWFDEQIKQRLISDDDDFAEAMAMLSDTITGKKTVLDGPLQEKTNKAINLILKSLNIKAAEIPDRITDLEEQLEFACRPHGVMRRVVHLESGWYRDAIGPMLGFKQDGTPVALIQNKISGYSMIDGDQKIRINKQTEKLLDLEAYCFYKPFPLRKIGIPDLAKYIIQEIPVSSVIAVLVMMLVTTLLGMISPQITKILFSDVVESKNIQVLIAMAVLAISVGVSTLLVRIISSFTNARLTSRLNLSVQAATMGRIFSLPADFFRKYNSGELSQRAYNINNLCNTLVSSIMMGSLSSLFSLIYVTQIFSYAPILVIPSLIFIAITVGFSIFTTYKQMKYDRQNLELSGKSYGLNYSMISGIQKIKLAGAEKRAFSRWARLYNEEIKTTYGKPIYLTITNTINTAITLVSTIVMYYFAIQSGISVSDYFAFTAAYGMITGAFMSLSVMASTVSTIKPTLEMAKPIMDAVPETNENKKMVERLSGSIELNHVYFRYNDSMPYIVNDLSLKIRPGQYVAIVGKTGCGKSTLVRLLLGFEKFEKGAIFYDGKDINDLDLKSLRHNIGTVMQDGKLFRGNIYENIAIASPGLSLDDAWKAAEVAGIADDIKAMPMGMHTIISEGSGGISGGQRQRLMIARAIAMNPKLLILDEATSALDNITQKKISDSLDQLKCTRIVIAHRLSTIRHCDRIIVLDGGKIIEDGTYEELIELGGFFAELVERQRLDT